MINEMEFKMTRFRNWFLLGGSIVVLLALVLTDPSGGSMTLILAQQLATPVLAVAFAHLARKALFDYLDLETLINKAKNSEVGAGLVFLGVSVIIYGLLGLFGAQIR